jgi:hypothetical protein
MGVCTPAPRAGHNPTHIRGIQSTLLRQGTRTVMCNGECVNEHVCMAKDAVVYQRPCKLRLRVHNKYTRILVAVRCVYLFSALTQKSLEHNPHHTQNQRTTLGLPASEHHMKMSS